MQIFSLIFLYLAHIACCLSYIIPQPSYQISPYSYQQSQYNYGQNPGYYCCLYYYQQPQPYFPQLYGAQFPVFAPFYMPYHHTNFGSNSARGRGNSNGFNQPTVNFGTYWPTSAYIPSIQSPWVPTTASTTAKPTTSFIPPVEPVIPELTTASYTTTGLSEFDLPAETTTKRSITNDDEFVWPSSDFDIDEIIAGRYGMNIDERIEGSGGYGMNDDEDSF